MNTVSSRSAIVNESTLVRRFDHAFHHRVNDIVRMVQLLCIKRDIFFCHVNFEGILGYLLIVASVSPENVVKVLEKHIENAGRNAQRSRKDNADVLECHFVFVRVLDYPNQVGT